MRNKSIITLISILYLVDSSTLRRARTKDHKSAVQEASSRKEQHEALEELTSAEKSFDWTRLLRQSMSFDVVDPTAPLTECPEDGAAEPGTPCTFIGERCEYDLFCCPDGVTCVNTTIFFCDEPGFTSPIVQPGIICPSECPGPGPPTVGDSCAPGDDLVTPCNYGAISCCGTEVLETSCSCEDGAWACSVPPKCPSPCPEEPVCPPDEATVLACTDNRLLDCDMGVKMCPEDPCAEDIVLVPSGPLATCGCFDSDWVCGATGCGAVVCPPECPAPDPPIVGDSCTSDFDLVSPCNYGEIDCCGTTVLETSCSCEDGSWFCSEPPVCASPCPEEAICPPENATVVSCMDSNELECDIGVKMCPEDQCADEIVLVPSGPIATCSCFEGVWGCTGTGCGVEFCGASEGEMCGGIAGIPCEGGLICVDDPTDDCASPTGADCSGLCVDRELCPFGPRVEYKGTPETCPTIRFECDEGLEFFGSPECGCGCTPPTLTECPLDEPPEPGTPCSFIATCEYDFACCPDGSNCANTTFANCDGGLTSPIAQSFLFCPPAAISECPENPPVGEERLCGSDFSCEYGLESCCGVDSPSLQCDCFENETIVCFNTDACFLPNCEFNCPEDSVASGSACDSTGFAGWIMFGEDGEPTEGSCLYDEESCSCPGLPGSGASCQCIDDVWACGEIPCENCVGIVNLTSVP